MKPVVWQGGQPGPGRNCCMLFDPFVCCGICG